MLALRPPPPSTTRHSENGGIHGRGRSRQVSNTALARQASEERRIAGLMVTMPAEHSRSEWLSSSSLDEKSALISDVYIPKLSIDALPAQTVVSEKSLPLRTPSEPASVPSQSPSPTTSASMSPDYHDSPPSPPRSLEDQVHIAYALDDIHLAKVLLLKLKGIKVTSDDDPRIAAVKDEDFDFCFVPYGGLMGEEDEKLLLERQQRDMEKLEEKKRADRLKACERIWVQEKQQLREARELARKQREIEVRRKVEEENRIKVNKERREALETEQRTRSSKLRMPAPPRSVVAYKIATPPSSRASEPFVYDLMITPRLPRPLSEPSINVQTSLSHKSTHSSTHPLFDESRTVPFSDVLASMQGPLFPPQRRHTSPISGSSSQDRKRRRNVELLDSLLKVVEREEDERRRRKGKGVQKPPIRRRRSERSTASLCAACSDLSASSSSLPSSSSSHPPSRLSWLSFSNTSSVSTVPTTPSASPSTWFGKPHTSPTKKSWFIPPKATFSTQPPIHHSCRSCTHLSPVTLAEGPLSILATTNHTSRERLHDAIPVSNFSQPTSPTGIKHAAAPAGQMVNRVLRFLEFAKGLQGAYMSAAQFSVAASSESFSDGHPSAAFFMNISDSWPSQKKGKNPSWKQPRPPGQRACPSDVAIFLGSLSGLITPTGTPPPIPLRSISDDIPRTVLPDPLPYPVVFKPIPKPCRSPFRLHAQTCLTQDEPDVGYNPIPAPWTSRSRNGAVVVRVRAVENPFYLRLKALNNVISSRSIGVVQVREGMLGAGREKVLQVAFEGIGRSWLGVELIDRYGAR